MLLLNYWRLAKVNVLGINLSHDTSVCLLSNGTVFAAEEERFTHIKHNTKIRNKAYYFPNESLRHVLLEAGISLNEVDRIVVSTMDTNLALGNVNKMMCKEIGREVELLGHHKAHALSGFCLSGFNEAVVLCIDGAGSMIGIDFNLRERVSGWYINNSGKCQRIFNVFDSVGIDNGVVKKNKNSLGNFYLNFAKRLIPKGDEAEGSMMALASYADEEEAQRYYKTIRNMIELLPYGRFQIKNWYGTQNNQNVIKINEIELSPNNIVASFSQRANIAFIVQMVFEETICHILDYLHKMTKCKNLVFVGGCALNSKLNGIIHRMSEFEHFFVPPAPNDAGIAIGCAYFANNFKDIGLASTDSAVGPEIQDLPKASIDYLKRMYDVTLFENSTETNHHVAELIYQDKIVIYAQGRMEFGPRALGHRSIIASPSKKSVAERVNRIKQRASFRPLAPSVLHDRFFDYFSGDSDPYMNKLSYVKKTNELLGVTHIDGTARVQLVYEDCPFYSLISEFEKLSSIPVILNTSCNLKGRPIDCSSQDIIRTFFELDVDACVINNTIIKKRLGGIYEITEGSINAIVDGICYTISSNEYSYSEIQRIKNVINYLVEIYRNRKRDQGTPFISHPLSVASIVYKEAGYKLTADNLCVALLHDALWMGSTIDEEISFFWGKEILNRVKHFTKPHILEDREKHNTDEYLFANQFAMMDDELFLIKVADKLANLREINLTENSKQRKFKKALVDIYIPIIKNRLDKEDFSELSILYTQLNKEINI